MHVAKTIKIAVRALAKNKLRGSLTVLGVVIGIAAVTTMVSIGQSAGSLVQSQLLGLGTNSLAIFPTRASTGGARMSAVTTLTAEDAKAIADECSAVLATSPIIRTSGQVVYGNANWNPDEMTGCGVDYLTVRNWQIRYGGFFTDRDMSGAAKVCVIGHAVVAKLFQTRNPLGEILRIKDTPFRVIGVLERKGANLIGEDQDNIVLMPYTTVQKRLQSSKFRSIHVIMASARTMEQTEEAEQQIRYLLAERHKIAPGESPDFEVRTMAEASNMMSIVTGTITLLLAAIAGISLVVGGVGIMNIMLVSVTERTREIGIRMAAGARSRDILRQFLVEAVLLSSIGGIVGVALGVSASVGITYAINTFTSVAWPVAISLPAAAIALVFAAAVGVFFGYYPARRASRLDPIEALRYE